MRKILNPRGWLSYIAHRRMIAFWTLALVALPAPWLMPGCTPQLQRHAGPVYDNCQVLNIHDGDSMNVRCQGEKIRVRLYCIDAPELGQEPWGRQARDYLRSITGPEVRLEVKDKDRYGRTVAVVWHQGEPLNLRMVKSGHAVVYPRYCNDESYFVAERRSKVTGTGVWSKAGTQLRPWEWRKTSK